MWQGRGPPVWSVLVGGIFGCAALDPAPTPTVPEWSVPAYFRDVAFLFELDDPTRRGPLPTASGLAFGDREVNYLRGRFWIQGRAFDFSPQTRVYLYRTPGRGVPWRSERAGLELLWVGDGVHYPVEVRTADRGYSWHLSGRRVDLEPATGRVLVKAKEGDRSFSAPGRLRMLAEGLSFDGVPRP